MKVIGGMARKIKTLRQQIDAEAAGAQKTKAVVDPDPSHAASGSDHSRDQNEHDNRAGPGPDLERLDCDPKM